MRRGLWGWCRPAVWLLLGSALTALLSSYLVPSRAAAAVRPAFAVTVGLSPNSIVADGVSRSVATATVTFGGIPLPGQEVTFSSSDSGIRFGTPIDNFDGTYTVTLISSTVAGTPTISATTQWAGETVSGDATLTQTPGPAAQMTLSLSPRSIVADGRSYTTATATVADVHGNPSPADTVVFSTSDPGQEVLPVTNNGNGTYSALIRSSTTPGPVVVQATDTATHLSARSVLTQTAGGKITSLVTMQWMFHYTLAYTKVLALVVSGAPAGTHVLIQCRGRACPFTQHRIAVADTRPCGPLGKRRCRIHHTLDLTRYFHGRSVRAGTRITVAITRALWPGKYYRFDTRAGRAPLVRITCLAPGEIRPGGPC